MSRLLRKTAGEHFVHHEYRLPLEVKCADVAANLELFTRLVTGYPEALHAYTELASARMCAQCVQAFGGDLARVETDALGGRVRRDPTTVQRMLDEDV